MPDEERIEELEEALGVLNLRLRQCHEAGLDVHLVSERETLASPFVYQIAGAARTYRPKPPRPVGNG